MSGAVVGQELAAEFGPLPPAFLPVGARRLYQLQIANLKPAGPVHLVLPESFQPSEYDQARLHALSAEIIPIPEGLRLGEAVIYAVNALGRTDAPVHILYGDVLFSRMPTGQTDVVVTDDHASEYARTEIEAERGRITALETVAAGEDGEGRPIAAGYFAFASSLDLVRALTRARGDFVGGVNQYLAAHAMRLAPALGWLDFGHAETYYRSRLSIGLARGANGAGTGGLTVRKSSEDKSKIHAEAAWLQAAPPELKPYCARVVDAGEDGAGAFYTTEREYLPPLSELFVYGAVGRKAWLRILSSCEDFLKLCATYPDEIEDGGDTLAALVEIKTLERLETFARDSGFPIDRDLAYDGRPCPSLTAMAEALNARIKSQRPRRRTLMHGDLCFSNILFSARMGRIRVRDPRGSWNGRPSPYGDLRYDLAKLALSVLGRYDQIIAGRYCIAASGADHTLGFETLACQAWLAEALRDLSVDGVGGADGVVRAVTVSLCLSLTPLHAERPDRQRAFVANALRLYLELDRA